MPGIRRVAAVSEIPGLLPTTIVSLALSRRFFLPLGIALHEDERFAHRIEEQMKLIVHLFTPIFFVFVGLRLNLREIDWSSPFIWVFSLSLFATAIISKPVGVFLSRNPGRCVGSLA